TTQTQGISLTVNPAASKPGGFTLSAAAPFCRTSAPVEPEIDLSWGQASGANSYDLYRDGALYSPGIPTTITTFQNYGSNVVAGQTYTYFVRAKNSTGTTDSNAVPVSISSTVCVASSFTISVSPGSQTVTQGNSTTFAVTVQSLGGFNSGVLLEGLNLPSGYASAGFSPGSTVTPPANGSTTATLTVGTNTSTVTGTASMTVRASSSGKTTQTQGISLTVNAAASKPGGFTLSAAAAFCRTSAPVEPEIDLSWGQASGATSCDLYRDGALYSPGIPTTITTFQNYGSNVVAGQTYTYFVRAKNSSSTTDSNGVPVSISSTVCVASSFTISVSPGSQTVTQGNSTTFAVTVQSLGGFNSGVLLEGLNLPSGYASAGFSPGSTVTPPANGSTTATLTVGTNTSTATGTASMTVRASSSGKTTQTQGISRIAHATASKPGGFTLSAAAQFCRTSAPVEPEIDLSWGQASGANSYDLYRDGALYSPGIPTTITTFQNYGSNVVAGQTYTYFVRAKNSTGTTDSNAVPVSISSTVCVASSFTISVSPGSQTVTQGNSTTFAVTVQSLGGFNSGVLLEGLNLPSGYASAGFSPGSTVTPPANGSTTATLTVGTNTSTATGTASMTVRASSSGKTTQTQGISRIAHATASKPGGFTLSAAAQFCRTSAPVEPEIDLSWGQASRATSYDLYRDGALYSPGIPTTITTFQNYGSNVVAGQTYTYFVRAKNSTGTTDSNAVPVSISSTVCVASSFTISVSPGSQTVTQGNSTTFAVTVQSLGGFNSGVLLEVLNLPAGYASAGFSPGSTVTPPANGSTTATLTVGTNTSTAAGAASMTVRASSSGKTTQTQGISLTVNPAASKPGGFTLSAAAPFCRTSAPVEPEIDLSWGQASGATSYDLYRDGALYSPGIPTTITTFQNYGSNVVAGQTYTYFVRAKNPTGTPGSNAVPLSISSPVCVPSSFTISVSPGRQTVTQGNSTTFAVTV